MIKMTILAELAVRELVEMTSEREVRTINQLSRENHERSSPANDKKIELRKFTNTTSTI